MSGGYKAPAGDSWDPLIGKLKKQGRRLSEVEMPTGTSYASALASLQKQVAYQASLITRGVSVTSFVSDPIPGDQVYRYIDGEPSVTLDVPTGRVLVSIGCERARLDPGDLTAECNISVSITNDGETEPWYPAGATRATLYSGNERYVGVGVSASVPIAVNKGVQTFKAAFGLWSSSEVVLADAEFLSPYITVQVIEPL